MAIVPRRDRTAVTTTTAAIGTATPIITGTPAGTHTGSTAIKGTVGIIVTVITMDTEAGHATTPVGTATAVNGRRLRCPVDRSCRGRRLSGARRRGLERDLEQQRPVLPGDEQAPLPRIVGDAVEHAGRRPLREQPAQIDPPQHLAGER